MVYDLLSICWITSFAFPIVGVMCAPTVSTLLCLLVGYTNVLAVFVQISSKANDMTIQIHWDACAGRNREQKHYEVTS